VKPRGPAHSRCLCMPRKRLSEARARVLDHVWACIAPDPGAELANMPCRGPPVTSLLCVLQRDLQN
jgi:hypothetical protein